jgi:hypothetical protein
MWVVSAAREEVGKLLGLGETRIKELLRIASLDEEVKAPIREQKIAGKTALAAHRIGGVEAVKSSQGLGFQAMERIASKFEGLPDGPAKEKVRKAFTEGKIGTPRRS